MTGTDPTRTEMSGRVAMVTGGGSGLGRATCRVLAEAGAHVLAADIDPAAAEATVAQVQEAGGSAEAVHLDVTDPGRVATTMGAAFEKHGAALDCLVNNAGTDRGADLVDIDDDAWHSVFAVNVDGPMYLSRAFVRYRTGLDVVPDQSAQVADLVFVVSISALTVGAGAAAYNASKAALGKFAEIVQTEAREHDWPVRVSSIHPAAMATPMMDQWQLPPERMMDPAIVAGVIRHAVTLPPEAVLQCAIPTLRNEYYPR